MNHCDQQMRYQSIEYSGLDGETLHIWNRVCMKCGYITKRMTKIIEGRLPMTWQEKYKADLIQDQKDKL